MLSIRLQRTGRKNEPTFRVVLTDSKNGPKSGKTLEVLGSYDSRRGEKADIKTDRIKHWMSVGAKPSGTMHNLLVERKVIDGKKVNVLPKKRPIAKEAAEGAEAQATVAETVPAENSATEAPAAEATAETPAQESAPEQAAA